MKTLNNRIQALPQELQDSIFESLVDIKPNQIVKIDNTLKAPWQLQINKKMRQKLAPIYFSSIFVMPFSARHPHRPTNITREWIRAQTRTHRATITSIRIYEEMIPDDVTHEKDHYESVLLMADVYFFGLRIRPNVLFETNVRYHDPDDGKIKEVWAGMKMLDGLFRCRCNVSIFENGS